MSLTTVTGHGQWASMTFDDLMTYWGSVEKARVALGLKSRQTLYNWRNGGIPGPEQCRIELLTAGKPGLNDCPPLKADESAVTKAA